MRNAKHFFEEVIEPKVHRKCLECGNSSQWFLSCPSLVTWALLKTWQEQSCGGCLKDLLVHPMDVTKVDDLSCCSFNFMRGGRWLRRRFMSPDNKRKLANKTFTTSKQNHSGYVILIVTRGNYCRTGVICSWILMTFEYKMPFTLGVAMLSGLNDLPLVGPCTGL